MELNDKWGKRERIIGSVARGKICAQSDCRAHALNQRTKATDSEKCLIQHKVLGDFESLNIGLQPFAALAFPSIPYLPSLGTGEQWRKRCLWRERLLFPPLTGCLPFVPSKSTLHPLHPAVCLGRHLQGSHQRAPLLSCFTGKRVQTWGVGSKEVT